VQDYQLVHAEWLLSSILNLILE